MKKVFLENISNINTILERDKLIQLRFQFFASIEGRKIINKQLGGQKAEMAFIKHKFFISLLNY